MVWYFEESAHEFLTTQGYTRLERAPWNVREDDVILLEDSTRPPYLLTAYIPVRITLTDKYPTFWRTSLTDYRAKIIRTEYQFSHQPLSEEDRTWMYDRWSTRWRSNDRVDVWRKK